MNRAPTLSEADQREYIGQLRLESLAGHLTAEQLQRLTAAVWASNTPRELYRRTRGRLGDPRPRGGWPMRRIVTFYLVIPLAMIVVTFFTALALKMGLVH